MKDVVDDALRELADFASKSWSNNAIVDRVEAIRKLRASEFAQATADAAHTVAMRKEVCSVLNITPGALVALPTENYP